MNVLQCPGSFHRRRCDSDDITTGFCKLASLEHGGIDIFGFGRGHRLHGNRMIRTDQDFPDPDLSGLAADRFEPGFAIGFHAELSGVE